MHASRHRSRQRRTSIMDAYCSRFGQLVDRKRAEVALLEAKHNAERVAEAAQSANRAKTEFLAKMSHEIRTPMNGVMGMTDLLSRSELTDRQRKFVNTAHQSAETLLNIINDILDFSRIEAGRFELDCADFDIRATIGDVIDLLAESAQGKGLEIAYIFSRKVPRWVRGDPNRLRQIVFNLVGNGIKFTDHGEVVVGVGVHQLDGESVVLSFDISDTGIGISPDVDKVRIFEPFEQADSTITRQFGGTGLGLAISQQIIEMMGGCLSVRSARGKGSTFRFTIKLSTSIAEPDQENQECFDLTGTKVLIVDDSATNREILHYYLTDWGATSEAAAGGPRALEMMRGAADRGEPFEIVLLDVMMPGMSGNEVAQTIKGDAALANAHIVFLTSLGCRSYPEDDGVSTNDAYLSKPVRHSELYNQIGILLGRADHPARNASENPMASESESDDTRVPLDAKILLAEDNPINQEVMVAHLKELGCRVEIAATGVEVLTAAERSRYDIVLMDCQMPDMDGFEATTKLRLKEQQRNEDRRVPIIAVTANAFEGERERCVAVGMDDYMSKPFNQEDLHERLQFWLDRRPSLNQSSDEVEAMRQARLYLFRQ